jgi:hypothetical protein
VLGRREEDVRLSAQRGEDKKLNHARSMIGGSNRDACLVNMNRSV